jgi:flagellar motor switch protein FliG
MAANVLDPENLTGPQKAAIFLMAMGEEFTASFFKKLDERKIKEIGRHMSEITSIPAEVLNAVMTEFLRSYNSDTNLFMSGKAFLEQTVTKSLGQDRGKEIYQAIDTDRAKVPFRELTYLPADNLINIIKGEHPQTIALILSYLSQDKAAEILSLLPEEMKGDIALRIVKIGQVQDDLIRELDGAIKRDLSTIGMATREFDGIETLANILNVIDGKTEEYLLSQIEEEDSELAEKIRQKMFVFEDLLQVDDRSFREILRNIDNEVVVKALKTASEEMKQKILGNLSERAAEMLKDDMEVMGPVRLSDVEEAQQNIIRTAKRLETEGQIVLLSKGKDDVFV